MPVVLEAGKMGPVDVAVIAFDGGDFNDEVAPALSGVQANGTVKIIDMAFVRKAADGTTSILEFADESVGEVFERITDSPVELLSKADLADLAEALMPETSAMVVVWENSWVARFAAEVRASHGRVAMLERIPQENVERAISALDEEPSITAVEE